MDNQEQIQQIVNSAVANIKYAAEVNSVIGQPIETSDGDTILPVSRLTFGFLAGGGEYGGAKKGIIKKGFIENNQFAGGSGGGATMTPIGFLVINDDGIYMVKAQQEESGLQKFVDIARDLIKGLGKKNDNKKH